MATLKFKDLKKINREEREKKLKDLSMELIKARSNIGKGGSSRIKETKKIIARILTINTADKEVLSKK